MDVPPVSHRQRFTRPDALPVAILPSRRQTADASKLARLPSSVSRPQSVVSPRLLLEPPGSKSLTTEERSHKISATILAIVRKGRKIPTHVNFGGFELEHIAKKEEGFDKVFPKGVLDIVSSDGNFWSVPVNIHRANVLWYNKKVFPPIRDGATGHASPRRLQGSVDRRDQMGRC